MLTVNLKSFFRKNAKADTRTPNSRPGSTTSTVITKITKFQGQCVLCFLFLFCFVLICSTIAKDCTKQLSAGGHVPKPHY